MEKKYNYIRKLLMLIAVLPLFSAVLPAQIAPTYTPYYWVGLATDGDDWGKLDNWSLSEHSIAPPGRAPDRKSNVIFNARSFANRNTVTISALAYCHNITFSDITGVTPTFSATGTGTLNIYGSSEWLSGMNLSVHQIYQNNSDLDTQEERTVNNNGAVLGNNINVTFSETRTITIIGNFQTGGEITINAGTLKCSGTEEEPREIKASALKVVNATVDIANSNIYLLNTFDINASSTINATNAHFYMGGGTSTTTFTSNGNKIFHHITFTKGGTINTSTTNSTAKIDRLGFGGSATLKGKFEIGELYMPKGGKFEDGSGTSYTIKNVFSVGTTCAEWVRLSASSGTSGISTINITSPTADINVNRALIKNLKIVGDNTPYSVNDSWDEGNNTGWSFPVHQEKTLYWIGGEGDWNVSANWTQNNDGTGGGECVPGPNDNVVFNDYSGFSGLHDGVSSSSEMYCKDIHFLGTDPQKAPKFSGSTLNVYGSSVWQENMQLNVSNIYYRNNNTPKTIQSNRVGSQAVSYIEETTTTTLLDDFTGGEIRVDAGTFYTFRDGDIDKSVEIHLSKNVQALGTATSSVRIELGKSRIYCTAFSTGSQFTTIDAGTSHIYLSGSNSRLIGADGHEYYDVTFQSTPGQNYLSTISTQPNSGRMVLNNVISENNTTLTGNFTMKNLSLAAGKTHTFMSARTMRIIENFSIGGDCVGMTTLKSSVAGNHSTISVPTTATVSARGLIMSDIHAEGDNGINTMFVANGSENKGNNDGWSFSSNPSPLYWVNGSGNWNEKEHWSFTKGGLGGDCVPGPSNDVYFGSYSNNPDVSGTVTVTISGEAYCRDIKIVGTTERIRLYTPGSSYGLNIYGSSEWQGEEKMTIVDVAKIDYRDTGLEKTIKSNGVVTGLSNSKIGFYETSSISLDDSLQVKGAINHYAGTWNTNDHNVYAYDYYPSDNITSVLPRIANLGSSHFYMGSGTISGLFRVFSEHVTLHAEDTHIHFIGRAAGNGNLHVRSGQKIHIVTFENPSSTGSFINVRDNSPGTAAYFDQVVFMGGGKMIGNCTFGELQLLSTSSEYTLTAESTQNTKTITGSLVMAGTPCFPLIIKGDGSVQAKLNVEAGTTFFDYINISNIDAAGGEHLTFGKNSIGQATNNMTFLSEIPGTIDGLGPNWECHIFDNDNPDTYTLKTTGFNGNEYTRYKWTKDGAEILEGVGSEADELDISQLGAGTYRVDVEYKNFSGDVRQQCDTYDEITIKAKTPSLDITELNVCNNPSSPATIGDVTGISSQGKITWYADDDENSVALPNDTVLEEGKTYYLTQTVDNCESLRTAITIKLVDCSRRVFINPSLRFRTRK